MIYRISGLKKWIPLFAIVILGACTGNYKKNPISKIHLTIDTSLLDFSDYRKGSINFESEDGNTHFREYPVKIKYRGNYSAHFDKKSFSLKFSDAQCLNDTICRKRWKINAEYIDKTFMRNKLSYDLFRNFSENNYAPHISYSLLYLNEEYHGIYSITEAINKNFFNIDDADTNAVIFKQPPLSYPPEEHQKRFDDFVAFTKWNEFYKPFSEKAFKKLLSRVYYNQRYPEIDESNKKYIIHELTDFVFNASSEDFGNEKKFNKLLDLENIIDWHILLLLSNNGDGLIRNFYLHRKAGNEPFRYSPWDYDHSYGRDGDGEPNSDSFIDSKRVKLLERLIESNAFNYRQKLYKRFLELKSQGILTTANIHNMIDENVMNLQPYIKENEKKWPLDSVSYFVESDFQSEISLMKNWIELRFVKIEDYLIMLNK